MSILPKHINTTAGSPPYKSLFSNVTIAPPAGSSSLAFISSQWAADATTGQLQAGTEGDYGKQSAATWTHIVGILKELGVGMKEVVHVTVNFKDFTEEIGKAVVEGQMSALPDEWKADALKSSLTFHGVAFFHQPGIVYTVELVVAVPALQ